MTKHLGCKHFTGLDASICDWESREVCDATIFDFLNLVDSRNWPRDRCFISCNTLWARSSPMQLPCIGACGVPSNETFKVVINNSLSDHLKPAAIDEDSPISPFHLLPMIQSLPQAWIFLKPTSVSFIHLWSSTIQYESAADDIKNHDDLINLKYHFTDHFCWRFFSCYLSSKLICEDSFAYSTSQVSW